MLLSLLIGAFASVVAVFVYNYAFSPKIAVSSKIIRTEKGRYLIKLQNKSRFREIYDITIHPRYRSAKNGYVSERNILVPLLNRKRKNPEDHQKPFEMKIELTGITLRDTGRRQDLKDFFNSIDPNYTYYEPYIEIVIICYDGFSGMTRHAITQRYKKENLIENAYFEEGILEPKTYPNKDDESGIQKYNDIV